VIIETIALSALLVISSSTPEPIANISSSDTLADVVAAGVVVETPLFRIAPATGGGWGKNADPG
jgi:hypothetical protein